MFSKSYIITQILVKYRITHNVKKKIQMDINIYQFVRNSQLYYKHKPYRHLKNCKKVYNYKRKKKLKLHNTDRPYIYLVANG